MGGVLRIFRRADWFDASRARGYARLAAVLVLACLVLACVTRNLQGASVDFGAFWAAGRLAWHDPLLAWHASELKALQPFADGRWSPFVNPPPFLFVAAPFGLLPFAAAHAAWVAVTLGLYLAAGRRYLRPAALVAYPAVFLNGLIGQNGLLTAAIFMAGLSRLERRPFTAGLILGLLVIKPQLAVLLPVALVGGRQWRAVAGAAVSSLGLVALSLLAFGPDAFREFLAATGLSREVLQSGLHAFKMQTVFAFVLALGGGAALAAIVQAAATLSAAAVVFLVWRGPADTVAKAAVLAALVPLATPYLYIYDLAVWAIPIGWLAAQGARHGFLDWERLAIGLLFAAPLVEWFASTAGLNLGPVFTVAIAGCVVRRLAPWRTPGPAAAACGADGPRVVTG